MIFDLLKTRRSIRKFQHIEVEKERIDIILKSALMAPSSRARRPWEFIAVRDKGNLKKLSECREHSSGFLSGAPLGIVVIADPDKCDVWIEDSSITAVIIQLTAQSLGLGSCWIQIRDRFDSHGVKAEEIVKETLNIPKAYTVECIIAIGYPAEEKRHWDESELQYEKIHYDVF